MKICLLTHTFPRFEGDTAAPFMGTLVEELAKLGHVVIVLTPYDEKFDFKQKRKYKLITYKYIYPNSLHLLGYSKTLKGDKKLGFINFLLSPFLYLFSFFSLLKTVRKEKADIISSHWIIPNGFIASLVSKITSIPFTVTIPGSDVYMASKNPFFRWMAGFAAQKASFVISDSKYYLNQLGELGYHPKNSKIIRYGVNTEVFKPKKINKSSKIILAVGRLVSKKGFQYLIEAMPSVLEKCKNVKLIIIGDGELRSFLRERIKNLGLKQNIKLMGSVKHNKILNYFNGADIFVMPSIKDEKGNIDASPVSMMEAMACGLPIVATKYVDGEGLIKNRQTGFLVKEKNSKEISDSLLKLLMIVNNNSKIRKKVRKVAVSNFSSKMCAEKYISLFGLSQ